MTADLRREEIARIAEVLHAQHIGCRTDVARYYMEHHKEDAETLYDRGIRSQDTATARIAELEGALRLLLDRIDYINGADAREVLDSIRAVLSGETE